MKWCAIGALTWALFSRAIGPSDLWDQAQPRTVSYTTDILINGGTHWILPIERGVAPATKPPLYNWLAAPVVRLLGFSSETAHKFPSAIALCLCWLIIVRLGRRIDSSGDQSLGWLAGLILPTNYMMHKLGYLARPDMLLTLWLLLAWVLSTAVLLRGQERELGGQASVESVHKPDVRTSTLQANQPPSLTALVIGFWLCIALAGLTKGPAALVGVAYPLIASRVLCGSWRAIGALRPLLGLPLVLLALGAWVWAAWLIDPQHVRQELWHDQLYGRITGLGPEGSRDGPLSWLTGLHKQVFYSFTRLVPWSLFALAAMIVLAWRWWHRRRDASHDQRPQMLADRWMVAAAIYQVVVIGLYSLSAGKRADYVAAAVGPAALLAAWWLLRAGPRLGVRWPWFAPGLAVSWCVVLNIDLYVQRWAPCKGFGEAIESFTNEASAAIAVEPMPVAFYASGETYLQATLGLSSKEGAEAVRALVEQRRPFWVVAGTRSNPPHEFDKWLATRKNVPATANPVVRSAELPRAHGWPGQVTLYRVTPADV